MKNFIYFLWCLFCVGWGFFITLGYALGYSENLFAILFIGGFISSQFVHVMED